MTGPIVGSSTYETWVLTLRAWSEDPTVPLDHLPALDERSFTVATYDRLLRYVVEALEAATERWVTGLERAFRSADSPFELGAQLVQLRRLLAHRLQLAAHPSLPASLRETLTADARQAVHNYQRELEDNLRRDTTHGRVGAAAREELLRVARENSFERLLAYDLTDGRRPEPAPLPDTSGSPGTGFARSARTRRVVISPDI